MQNRVSLGSTIKVTLLGYYRSSHCEVLLENRFSWIIKIQKNVTFGEILEKFQWSSSFFVLLKNELIHRYISKILPTSQEQLSVPASIILFVFFLARSIFLKTKIEPYSNVLGEIILGLNRFNLIKHMQKRPDVFKQLFCKSDLLNGLWTSSSKLYKSIGRDLVQMRKNSNWNVIKPFKKCWILRFMMVRWRKFSFNRSLLIRWSLY